MTHPEPSDSTWLTVFTPFLGLALWALIIAGAAYALR